MRESCARRGLPTLKSRPGRQTRCTTASRGIISWYSISGCRQWKDSCSILSENVYLLLSVFSPSAVRTCSFRVRLPKCSRGRRVTVDAAGYWTIAGWFSARGDWFIDWIRSASRVCHSRGTRLVGLRQSRREARRYLGRRDIIRWLPFVCLLLSNLQSWPRSMELRQFQRQWFRPRLQTQNH